MIGGVPGVGHGFFETLSRPKSDLQKGKEGTSKSGKGGTGGGALSCS